MRRVGLLGGTFNPIHLGHVRAALDVKGLLRLDQVVLIPSAKPPHKPSVNLAPGKDRLAMIGLAIADHPALVASDMELKRPGPSYTLDTVVSFQQQGGGHDRFVFLVGVDAFLEMDGWYRYRDIFKTIEIVVITRPGNRSASDLGSQVETFLREKLSPAFQRRDTPAGFVAPGFAPITLAVATPVAISATTIRMCVRQGRSIAAFVHPAVRRYIEQKGLYR